MPECKGREPKDFYKTGYELGRKMALAKLKQLRARRARLSTMRESILALNQSPLGQKAKELLQKAKVDADPHILYVLQVAQWFLAERKQSIPGVQERENAHLMQELVDQLSDRSPKRVLKMFLPPDDQSEGVQQECEHQLLCGNPSTPEQLGQRLVENLWANLSNPSPYLNPPHSLE